MTEDIYLRLGERLNHYQVKMLLVDGYLNILREIYTEEEALVGAEVPLGSHTAAELSEKLGRDEASLTSLMETMADKGTVFVTKTEEGIHRYALTPFVPGVVEFQLVPRQLSADTYNQTGVIHEESHSRSVVCDIGHIPGWLPIAGGIPDQK